MRLDGPGPATLSWLSLVKAARGRVAKSHLGMYSGMAAEREVDVDGVRALGFSRRGRVPSCTVDFTGVFIKA